MLYPYFERPLPLIKEGWRSSLQIERQENASAETFSIALGLSVSSSKLWRQSQFVFSKKQRGTKYSSIQFIRVSKYDSRMLLLPLFTGITHLYSSSTSLPRQYSSSSYSIAFCSGEKQEERRVGMRIEAWERELRESGCSLERWKDQLTSQTAGRGTGPLATAIISAENSSAQLMQKQIRPLVVVGPSGSGKTTLINRLLAHPNFKLSVSLTTRKPRATELNGRQYNFVTKEEFQRSISQGVFLQFCQVHDNFYGTSKKVLDEVKSQGLICVLDIDVQGAEKVHKSQYPCNFVFILPESVEQLGRRLRERGLDCQQVILKRLRNAQKEIKRGKELQFFQYIQNVKLEKAVSELQGYIVRKYGLDLEL